MADFISKYTSAEIDKAIEIALGEPPPAFEIDPRWNWFDLKGVINSSSNFRDSYCVAEMIYNSFPTNEFRIETNSGVDDYYPVAIYTSDGAYYTTTARHIWDESQDRQLYKTQKNPDGTETITESAKARWVIKIYSREIVNLSIPHECFYFVVNRARLSRYTVIGSIHESLAHKSLIYFDLINGAEQQRIELAQYMFQNCFSLQAVPPLNTERIYDTINMFYNCYSLVSVPLFDTSAVLDMSRMFASCRSLQFVPMFDTFKVERMSGMFHSCSSLVSIPPLTVSDTRYLDQLFVNCYSLVAPRLKGIRAALDIATMPYPTNLLNRESILFIVHNRNLDIAGSITLTIGATNIVKLTTEEKAMAAANRITLA